jgi:hypothetical protein
MQHRVSATEHTPSSVEWVRCGAVQPANDLVHLTRVDDFTRPTSTRRGTQRHILAGDHQRIHLRAITGMNGSVVGRSVGQSVTA